MCGYMIESVLLFVLSVYAVLLSFFVTHYIGLFQELKHVDASFNKITTLDGLKVCYHLL